MVKKIKGFLERFEEESEVSRPKEKSLLEIALEKLCEQYEPADNQEQCTDFITTDRIFEELQAVYPSEGLFGYGKSTIAEILNAHGWKLYRHTITGGFYWQVKTKEL